MSVHVRLHEVGPRDGLQNEARIIPVEDKLRLISALASAGLQELEVGSFVSPKWVPQMADTDRVMAALPEDASLRYSVLVPNLRGWDAFLAARRPGVRYRVAVFISASEGFSRANLNCSIAESVARIAPVVEAALVDGTDLRGYVSCVTNCPFDGPVAPLAVVDAVGKLRELAPMQISLGETIGEGTPDRVAAMLEAVLGGFPAAALAGHFHDTGGQALGNIGVALELGLRDFDCAVGGLGGCPYAPGAPGNVATEQVVAFLHDKGFATGVDVARLKQAAVIAKGLR